MRDLTIVFPHFSNLGMLEEQQKVWMDYPSALRERLHVVIVDDCSPKGAKPGKKQITATGLGSIRLFRLLKKKVWNWLACRNLGAKVARTEWLLLTDIDHVVPKATLERLLDGELDPRNVYRFKRVVAPRPWPYMPFECEDYKPHNDTWLLTRAMFFDPKVGGYDERLSGCYGTSGEFTDRIRAASRAQVLLPEVIVRYPREVIADASTLPTVYNRKNDPINDDELQRRKADRAKIPDWTPLHGLVPSEEVPLC